MSLSFFFIPNVQQDEQTFQVKLFKKSTSTNFSCITIILCFNDTSENARAALFYMYVAKSSGNMDELTSNTQKQKQILENTNIHVLEETGSKYMLYAVNSKSDIWNDNLDRKDEADVQKHTSYHTLCILVLSLLRGLLFIIHLLPPSHRNNRHRIRTPLFSQSNFVSTKWRISKSIFARPNPAGMQVNLRGCEE